MAQTFRWEPDLDKKFAEKAEHTQVCEQFSANFLSKGGHIWTFQSCAEELRKSIKTRSEHRE